jgi:hypothetical protein
MISHKIEVQEQVAEPGRTWVIEVEINVSLSDEKYGEI